MWYCHLCRVSFAAESVENHIYMNHLKPNFGSIKIYSCGDCLFSAEGFEDIARHFFDLGHKPTKTVKGLDYDEYASKLFIALESIMENAGSDPKTKTTSGAAPNGKNAAGDNGDNIILPPIDTFDERWPQNNNRNSNNNYKNVSPPVWSTPQPQPLNNPAAATAGQLRNNAEAEAPTFSEEEFARPRRASTPIIPDNMDSFRRNNISIYQQNTADRLRRAAKTTLMNGGNRKLLSSKPFFVPTTAKNSNNNNGRGESGNNNNNRFFKCPECPRYFTLTATLIAHRQKKHGRGGSITSRGRPPTTTTTTTKIRGLDGGGGGLKRRIITRGDHHQCSYCNQVFNTSINLMGHLKLHEMGATKTEQVQKRRRGGGAKSAAADYGFRASPPPPINQSPANNNNEKPISMPFRCKNCPKGFMYSHTLKDHLASAHGVYVSTVEA